MKVERILANNAGPFTGPGTNTWVLEAESGSAIVIDPGPLDDKHESAILDRLEGRDVEAVLVTHTHLDHAPMANPLARLIDVPAMGFAAGPEFEPDQRLDEGSEFGVGELELRIIQTPGHSDDHLCFRVGDVLFSGDHIIGGSSVMVETMGPYLDSLRKLRGTGLRRLLPGHGNEMNNPDEVIDWYLAHRLQRHEEIAQAISEGASNRKELVETVYSAVDSSLYPLASRSVEAHLALLYDEGRIAYEKDTIVLVPPNPQ